jgi:F0F1-type ATP synthase beta subunit
LQTVIGDVNDILGGVYDGLPEEKFLYVQSAKEAKG